MRISPSMGVSLLALLLSLGSVGYAANGGALLMGLVNSATQRTYLGANYNGTALQVANTAAGASATALSLSVAAGRPPMTVNSATRVTNLNADYVDGIDGTLLARSRRIPYTLGPGATSASIAVPANLPVHLMGDYLADRFPGMGMALLLNDNNIDLFWLGAVSRVTEPDPEGGTNAVGEHIVFLDFKSNVEVQTNGPSAIRIHNQGAETTTGSVTLVW